VFIDGSGRSKPTLHVDNIYDCDFSIYKLFRWFEDIRHSQTSQLDIVVDFSHCTFFGHIGVAFLGGLARWIELHGGRIHFDCDTLLPKIRVNLQQNGFLSDFGYSTSGWQGNSVPYRHDREISEQSFGHYLDSSWLGQGWVDVPSQTKPSIIKQASEIYVNAFEHGCSEVGVFSCGQRYPKATMLHLAVIDFGVGIASNVRTVPGNQEMSASDAILWAFEYGHSTRQQSIPGGIGLNSLQRFIASHSGDLSVFSGDGCAKMSHNGSMRQDRCTSFPGTLVNIALRCDSSVYQPGPTAASARKAWF